MVRLKQRLLERFKGLENPANRPAALGVMAARAVNILTAFLFWLSTWNFQPPRLIAVATLLTFGLIAAAYLVLLPRVLAWREPSLTQLELVLIDFAAITVAVVDSGGLHSPFFVLFFFPVLVGFFYDNRGLVDAAIGGVAASVLIVFVASEISTAPPLTGPDVSMAIFATWQIPFLLTTLTVAFFVNRRTAERQARAAGETVTLRRQLGDANEELTRSFYDLESALDRGRANQDLAQHSRQQLLRAERFSAAGKLAAGIVHDMSDSLSIIMSDAELFFIKFEDRPDKAKETIHRVLSNAQHVARLIDNLRLLTKQRGDAIYAPVDLRHTVMRCLAAVEPERKRRGVVIDTILEDKAPKVRGIESQLEQMIVDLIINAFESISRPGGRVTLRTRPGDDELIFEIEDDGEGIDAQYIDQIFEPFFSTRATSSALGLGLFSVRVIVEDHNGTINVSSKPGVGTRFTVQLPVEPSADSNRTDRI
jgi:signal transduction histidine kinase